MSRIQLFPPPARLRPLSDRASLAARILWGLLFAFALGAVAAGTSYALRETREIRPSFERLGLDYDVDYEGPVRVSPRGAAGTVPKGRVIRIDGAPVDPDQLVSSLAAGLDRAAGRTVTLTIEQDDGQQVELRRAAIDKRSVHIARDRYVRISIRLAFSLLAVTIALLCALLLALRRPRDPVAMLFAFCFAAMAGAVDPPLPMWMAYGLARVDDTLGGLWFCSMLVALATFPDGIFVPRLYRWVLWLGLPLALFICWPTFNALAQSLTAGGVMLAMLVGQIGRYRRLPEGIERQQIKWAFFGFAVGLTLMFLTLVAVTFLPDDHSKLAVYGGLVVVSLFSLSIAIIPLGLLIGLLRFRLWEADKVISRSAAYAVVTMIVGVVWAATADLVKLVVTSVVGNEHQAASTVLGAVIAGGVFAPTQSLVVGWTKRRFAGAAGRIERLEEQLKEWQLALAPDDLAARALAGIDHAIHFSFAAVVLEGQDRPLAATGPFDRAAARLSQPLDTGDGRLGMLLIGPRSDGNRYNAEEIACAGTIAAPLAAAISLSSARHGRELAMQRTIEEMAARLAQLEGGTAPEPA